MDILDFIEARLAAPKRFRTTTTYRNGDIRHHDTETLAQAENWADGERRKIGKKVINRDTRETTFVVSVTVRALEMDE